MATLVYSGWKFRHGEFTPVADTLAVEQALSISVNGKPFTITMRSPGNEEELVRGLLFTEDVYRDRSLHPEMEVTEKDKLGFVTAINTRIDAGKLGTRYLNSRNLLSVSSCGICGKTELDLPDPSSQQFSEEDLIKAETVLDMFRQMNEQQDTFRQSGGSHAAGAFTLNGELLAIMEDIGRHNAVDKVIGRLLMDGNLKQARCLIVSGRISYEIVSKCFAAGIPFLASVSAPSSMAVDFSKELGITLMAFCREDRITVYSNIEKVLHSGLVRAVQQ
jgi:FdhD protein